MTYLKRKFSSNQIKALLKKDVLVRWRQPWMTVVQFIWPCLIFFALYLIRNRFAPENIDNCQFPTRQLPTKNEVIPFFHSYICSIENKCISTEEYQEYSSLDKAPVKPIIDIIQILINDNSLYEMLIDLPESGNFISAVTKVVTSSHFDDIRKSVEKAIASVPIVEEMLRGRFDITKLFSDRNTFVKGGQLLCGHPFPNTDVIPIVNDILYSQDFSEVNDDEIKAMPTDYCKKLYLDVTRTNHGKLTWSQIKPIIHGKILYAPITEDTESIIKFSNTTFDEVNRLKSLSIAVEQTLYKLQTNETFQEKYDSLLHLARSPIVKSLIGDDFDVKQIESAMITIRSDKDVYEIVRTIKNILECFSVDRFVPVKSETNLHKMAFKLNQQRLFYGAVYFNQTNEKNIIYKLHMDTDNTPPTLDNRKRFWFPGPEGNMIEDLKYHRGFAQIKHSIDIGIIRYKKSEARRLGLFAEESSLTTTTKSPFIISKIDIDSDGDNDDDDDWFADTESNIKNMSETIGVQGTLELLGNVVNSFRTLNSTPSGISNETTTISNSSMEDDDDDGNVTAPPEKILVRKKRQGFMDLLLGLVSDENTPVDRFEVDDLKFYTKQFPYPAYVHDDFKVGLYIGQGIQVAFYIGLLAHIASCIRQRIWMRESRNSMLMRSMGLKPSSELISWVIITKIELLAILVTVTFAMYTGGMIMYTKCSFVITFLIFFGFALISFCYMCSTFFTSATIGAVASSIFFLISFCPYILVLLFDAHLNGLQTFVLNLSFTTAFAQAWNHILRQELAQDGLNFSTAFKDGFDAEFTFALFMIILDTILYAGIGYVCQSRKEDEFQFVCVERGNLESKTGAIMTHVSKVYDGNKIAVSNISLTFPRNQVTCLLGRNGAGKSTIIKMLTGQTVQSSGRVILSDALSHNSDFDKIGVCSQDNILIPNLTAREHLELYARIKLKYFFASDIEKTLRSLNFGEHENCKASELSGGFQRRLCVALAFVGSPNVVILDEPCNGIDTKARRAIWELIGKLRKDRAVIFATHFLDEAEYLSDSIVIMRNGKIISTHNPESLKNIFTKNFHLNLRCRDTIGSKEIVKNLPNYLKNFELLETSQSIELKLAVPYNDDSNKCSELMDYLQYLHKNGVIDDLSIESKTLDDVFRELDNENVKKAGNQNGHTPSLQLKKIELKEYGSNMVREEPLSHCEACSQLLWKRLTHFSRNYKLLLCILVIPAFFEIFAMWFIAYRPEDDFDKALKLSRDLYPQTTQMISLENPTNFTDTIYSSLQTECNDDERHCVELPDSKEAFYWILSTLPEYREKRYGGLTFNKSRVIVWYNNKGHHSIMSWLNDLNSHVLAAEMNDSQYSITTLNEPWKLGDREISVTSIVRQAGDSSVSFILLISLSLVIAVSSVYLVNERVKGEKLQQKLCGVRATTYWGVAFVWDFCVLFIAIMICTIIILAFGMPVFVAKSNLHGIIVLALLYGFACIPAIHVMEKCFNDSSTAIVTIFSMNAIIPLATMGLVIVLGVIGDSEIVEEWRFFLNRAFLIFPQHALGDGLVEICKNFVVAEYFHRFDINSYKNPVTSDLLKPHFIALILIGIVFIILNVIIESGLMHYLRELLRFEFLPVNREKPVEELRIVSIQNSLKRTDNNKSDSYDETPNAVNVENLSKAYRGGDFAVRNINFQVRPGECLALLGKNGAGKSSIFKMLSGQMYPDGGTITYFDKEISYCPQTNTLDDLLTVMESIEFYGRLRRINDIPQLVSSILASFQLDAYKDILVKNLSGGNRRKLTVATTCFGRTSVVLMDEPTSDMDPVTRAIVYDTIQNLIDEQRAIILTSHTIAEIDDICHRIAVLKNGEIITCSSPESLRSQYGGYYNVTVFCGQTVTQVVEKDIRKFFPQSCELQIYSHLVKFSLKIDKHSTKENGIDVSQTTVDNSPQTFTLADLFCSMNELMEQHSIQFTINCCQLDAIFEKVLDSKDNIMTNQMNRESLSSPLGSSPAGYIHRGFVETEINE